MFRTSFYDFSCHLRATTVNITPVTHRQLQIKFCLLSCQCTFNFGLNLEIGWTACYGKSRLFPSRFPHLHISSCITTAVCYCGPVVQFLYREAERQGSVVRILRSLFFFFFFYYYYFIITFCVYFIPFICNYYNYFFLICFKLWFSLFLLVVWSGDYAG